MLDSASTKGKDGAARALDPAGFWAVEPGERSLLAGIDRSKREIFWRLGRARSFEAGEEIYRLGEYGDSFFVVVAGCVELRSPSGAREQVRAETHDAADLGEVFGEMCLLDLEPRGEQAVALERVTVWEINRDDLYWLFGTDKELQLQLLLAVARMSRRRLSRLLALEPQSEP